MITVRHLTKEFPIRQPATGLWQKFRRLVSPARGIIRAVDRISFEIEPGEVVGYIGPNGAGKSTTIKLLTGILVPTSGEVIVDGLVPYRQRIQYVRRIGVVFGQRTQLWWDLPLIDSFRLLRHIYEIPKARFIENLGFFSEILDLRDFLYTPVRKLSLGQRMRGDIVAALLHDPKILFLDEPTIGLDIVVKQRLREFIRAINAERQVTVLLSTHDLIDIEKLCHRLLIIDHGRIVYQGTMHEMFDRFGTYRTLVADLAGPVGKVIVDGGEVIKREGQRYWIRFCRHVVSAAEIIRRISSRYEIIDLTVEEPEIEAVVAEIYRRGKEPDSFSDFKQRRY